MVVKDVEVSNAVVDIVGIDVSAADVDDTADVESTAMKRNYNDTCVAQCTSMEKNIMPFELTQTPQ